MTRKIIIDTDPGQDDAVAILLALASPELDVLGLTAVAGNVPLPLTQRNARQIVELSGHATRSTPAATRPSPASSSPPNTSTENRPRRHPAARPDPPAAGNARRRLPDRHAAPAPPRHHHPLPLGPLTNIATAFTRAPDIIAKVAEIVLMGGAYFEVGNITPAAEFNIYVDPEAAKSCSNPACRWWSCPWTSPTRP